MKAVFCIVWLLCAALALASIDTRPDPPALNPGAGQSKIFLPDDHVSTTVTDSVSTLGILNFSAVSLICTGDCEPYRPSDSLVLTSVAADSSPPAVPAP